MRIKTTLIMTVLTLSLNQLFGQNFAECKVDFYLLSSQETFDKKDIGKEFELKSNAIPSYTLVNKPSKTKSDLINELTSKLLDNQEYNRNDSKKALEIIWDFTEQIERLGITLIWLDFIGDANKNEMKEFNKKTTESDFITIEEYEMYLEFFRVEYSGVSLTNENIRKYSVWDRYEIFQSIAEAIARYKRIKSFNEIVILYEEKKYRLNQKEIPTCNPFFTIQEKTDSKSVYRFSSILGERIFIDSNIPIIPIASSCDVCVFPLGVKPIFDLTKFNDSQIILTGVPPIYSNPNKEKAVHLSFTVDDIYNLSVYNFKQKYPYQPSEDISIEIFHDKKKLSKIKELLNSLKSTNLFIIYNGNEYRNPQIQNLQFDYDSLVIDFKHEDVPHRVTYWGMKDPIFRYNQGWPDRRAKTIFDLPIYYSECYNKILNEFNSMTLPEDNFYDNQQKELLLNTIKSSSEWLDFNINKVVLTRRSQWVFELNQWTGVQESRFCFADVYCKNILNGKCFLIKDVYFMQNADPLNGFIYNPFVSGPQNMQPYPCNLK